MATNPPVTPGLAMATAATMDSGAVLTALGSSSDGLSIEAAAQRLSEIGPNVLRDHGASGWRVLANQLRNPLLPLLVVASVVSGLTGNVTDAAIIVVMVLLSVGLGFYNEYRSEKAVEALHGQIHHRTTVVRAGALATIDVVDVVPGDVVQLGVGDVVPADIRLLDVDRFECGEAVLTGESMPAEKQTAPVTTVDSPIALPPCAFMGTVVHGGRARGVVVRTGARTEFGKIAMQLGERHAETSFQRGLRDFSKLLVRITAALVTAIFVINVAIGRPVIDAVLFSLAVAVGITPELLPAIVTISLATGAKRMATKSVLVRRLVAIEDFGNISVLFTDKTGTLTEGQITFTGADDVNGTQSGDVLLLGLLCTDVVLESGVPTGGSPLDQALWGAPGAHPGEMSEWKVADTAAFDYTRRRMSVLATAPDGTRHIITKGAPESVLAACTVPPAGAETFLDTAFDAGERVVAVATRAAGDRTTVDPEDEHDLTLAGFLTFVDPPKADAAAALKRLADLGIAVKIVTGDNERVARTVCVGLGLEVGRSIGGSELEALSDADLTAAIPAASIFARVTPEQKSRIIRLARASGLDVGYMGDGVNDAVALHDADVGISVDTAADVAKDAADILLLKKDLATLADGVVEGRRVFANTIKYVLMATSSNFGNMFSAAAASAFLKFLPMLPSQILLNNLLYDASQTTIPTDRVDPELLEQPSHWDTRFIRRFMMFFGPISSLFDFATFFVMLRIFHAGPSLFRSGWFVESLATQTLVIFVIRTRRVPFFKSRPSRTQLVATCACAGAGFAIPYIGPLARLLGFTPLPLGFLFIVTGFVAVYLTLAELGKARFFRLEPVGGGRPLARPHDPLHRRVHRRAERWTARGPVAARGS